MKKNILLSCCSLLFALVILLLVSIMLEPIGLENEDHALQTTMARLLPGSSSFTPEAYTGEDENITAVYKADIGYVVETTVSGYAGEMRLLVGVRDDGTVSGLTVAHSSETAGLGQTVLYDQEFLSQYLGTAGDAAVGENIDALTGATVTTKAVTRAVNSAAAFVTGADATSSATEWSG